MTDGLLTILLVLIIALQGVIVGLYIADAVHGRDRHEKGV